VARAAARANGPAGDAAAAAVAERATEHGTPASEPPAATAYAAAVAWLTARRRDGRARDPAVAAALLERWGVTLPPAVLHVVGTNGKGTVAHLLAAMATAAGHRTGRFTSPHVEDLRERVAVDGVAPTEADVVRFVARAQAIDAPGVGFFEWTLAWAVDTFAAAGVDLAVVEAGVGARRDATLALPHVIGTVLTNVDLDHVETLGPTLEDIARDKAAVARTGVPLVTGARGVALEVVAAAAAAVGAPLVAIDAGSPLAAWPTGTPYDVVRWPATRRENARFALALGRTLGWPEAALAAGLAAPPPPARFERFVVPGPTGSVDVVLDGAHDPAAAARLAAALPAGYVLVFGALARKQAAATLAPLGARASSVLQTTADTEEPSFGAVDGAPWFDDPVAALAAGVVQADALGASVAVAGSLHLAGRVRPWLRAHDVTGSASGAGGHVGQRRDGADAGAMLGGRWDASGSSA
jgi:dihydrofolate synthase / folylpolyglutamate synthase